MEPRYTRAELKEAFRRWYAGECEQGTPIEDEVWEAKSPEDKAEAMTAFLVWLLENR